MSKYAIISTADVLNLSEFEEQSTRDFIGDQNQSFVVCDDFDSAVSEFLSRLSEDVPDYWESVGVIAECLEENDEIDEDESEKILAVIERIETIIGEQKAFDTDCVNVSYSEDIGSDSDYLDVTDNEYTLRQLLNYDCNRTVHTNILRMDNPDKNYFFTMMDKDEEGCQVYSVKMFQIK